MYRAVVYTLNPSWTYVIVISIDHLLKEVFHRAMAKRGFEEMMEHTSADQRADHGDEGLFDADAGPQTIEQLWFWPTVAISRLGVAEVHNEHAQFVSELVFKIRMGFKMSTAYSGVGSAETALSFIIQAMKRLGVYLDESEGATIVSACDCSYLEWFVVVFYGKNRCEDSKNKRSFVG